MLGSGHMLAVGLADQVQQVTDAEQAPAKVAVDPLSADADTHVRALAVETLTRGLALRLPVRPMTRRGRCLLVVTEPGEREPDHLADARRALRAGYDDALTGLIPDPERHGATAEGNRRRFAEGLRLYVEHRLGTAWLVSCRSRGWRRGPARSRPARRACPYRRTRPPWNRERWAKRRRNEVWARLIGGWAAAIAPERPVTQVHALRRAVRDEDGALDAVFDIGSASGYSRRVT